MGEGRRLKLSKGFLGKLFLGVLALALLAYVVSADSMAERTVESSWPSAESMGLASSLLKRRNTAGETALWNLERARMEEEVVERERGVEEKEVLEAPATRKAARRMRCLAILVSLRFLYTRVRNRIDLHDRR